MEVIARFPAHPSSGRVDHATVAHPAAMPSPMPVRAVSRGGVESTFPWRSIIVLAVIVIGVWSLAIRRDGVRRGAGDTGQSVAVRQGTAQSARVAQEPGPSVHDGTRIPQ